MKKRGEASPRTAIGFANTPLPPLLRPFDIEHSAFFIPDVFKRSFSWTII
jgi:hypothetical protein